MTPLESIIVTAVITAIVSTVGTGSVLYFTLSNRLSVLETLMTDLRADVEKHNSVVERVYKLESSDSTQWRRIDATTDKLDKLEREHLTRYVGNHRYEHDNGHGGGGNG